MPTSTTKVAPSQQDTKIPFPSSYLKALKAGSKTKTYRVLDELGKYKPGERYQTMSYGGSVWPVYIEIQVNP